MHRRHFTLLELMAAMVVLVIMMGFLFHFIASTQDLWSASERNARIYENAQIFFELVEQDLNGAMVSDVPGQEIGFWVGDATTDTADFLTMVSNMDPLTTGDFGVCEVHYKLFRAAPTDTTFTLKRALVAQSDTTGAWDFYGKRETVVPPSWVASDGGVNNWQEVIDGIESIDMKFSPANVNATNYTLPLAARIQITLVDQKAIDLKLSGQPLTDRLNASRRQFTKVIFLNR